MSDLKLFSGNATPELASEIAKCLYTNLSDATVDTFSDGEVHIQIEVKEFFVAFLPGSFPRVGDDHIICIRQCRENRVIESKGFLITYIFNSFLFVMGNDSVNTEKVSPSEQENSGCVWKKLAIYPGRNGAADFLEVYAGDLTIKHQQKNHGWEKYAQRERLRYR